MIFGYIRVSTEKQEFDRQLLALQDFAQSKGISFDRIFADKITGKIFHRPQYDELKKLIKSGDTLVIKEIDRLGRDWDMTAAEWRYFLDNDIRIIVIDMPILNIEGEMSLETRLIKEQVFTLMLYLAQKEREKISQRTREALQAKKASGVVLGRPTTVSSHEVIALYNKGLSYDEIQKQLKVGRGRIADIVREAIGKGLSQARRQSWRGLS